MNDDHRDLLVKIVIAAVILLSIREFFVPWITRPENFSRFMDLSVVVVTVFVLLMLLDDLYKRLKEHF